MDAAAVEAAVVPTLVRARARGYLGEGPVERHVTQALGALGAFARAVRGLAVDLGSGGGVPGLVLALALPDWRFVLVERSEQRASFLRAAVGALGLAARVEVRAEPAEAVARSSLRGQVDVVTARSFARPAITAEIGAPLLVLGGVLVVSEPPPGEAAARWDPDGLAMLGLAEASPLEGYAPFTKVADTPDRFPRRWAAIQRAPLW